MVAKITLNDYWREFFRAHHVCTIFSLFCINSQTFQILRYTHQKLVPWAGNIYFQPKKKNAREPYYIYKGIVLRILIGLGTF